MIEVRITATDAEADVIAAALEGILDSIEIAPRRYPDDRDGSRVRAYVRAPALLPDFLPDPAPPPPARPVAGTGREPYPVPAFDGAPTPSRQRWNPTLGRHAWWHPREHWYRCTWCGVHKHGQPGGGGAGWFFRWGYPEWPAGQWGTTRHGAPFPRCPGPDQKVSTSR